MKIVERERHIDGRYYALYGFDWDAMEAIYRAVVNGEAQYIRCIDLKKGWKSDYIGTSY